MAKHPGPFFFAWANADDTAFGHEFVRIDEEIFSFAISHAEGDFPSLEVTIVNPRVGLLAPGRKVWAWLSFNRDWSPNPPDQVSESESENESESESESESEAGSIIPLFFGRLVGVPEDLDAEFVRLSFIARPENFQAQKIAVAEALKVRPYWDAIWFSPENLADPDNVLESRPALWHIDRTTLQVTTSHILSGEDGLISIGEDDVFYDSVRVNYSQAPVRRVKVTAGVSWNQNATGLVNLSLFTYFGNGYSILTYTGDGLLTSWPKPGASFGGGWTVADGKVTRVDGQGNAALVYGPQSKFGRTPNMHDVTIQPEALVIFTPFPALVLRVPRWQMAPTLVAQYDVSRSKSETLSFTLEADVQSVLTEPGDEEVLEVALSSSEIASPIDPADALPIGDVRSAVYFSGPRGAQSIEYLIALARARLLARARTVFVDVEIPFLMGVDFNLSCRKSIVFADSRLPGGLAAGKITNYTLAVDGDSGAMTCSITFGCSVGKGNTVSAVDGDPTYVQNGYVDPGYQRYEGQFVMPILGEVTYQSIEGLPANDDGIDFFRMTPQRVVLSADRTGGYAEQEAAMGSEAAEPNELFERLNGVPTTFEIDLVPVTGGPFTTDFTLEVSDLMVPKTIDLEAPSVP